MLEKQLFFINIFMIILQIFVQQLVLIYSKNVLLVKIINVFIYNYGIQQDRNGRSGNASVASDHKNAVRSLMPGSRALD